VTAATVTNRHDGSYCTIARARADTCGGTMATVATVCDGKRQAQRSRERRIHAPENGVDAARISLEVPP
jgi:hypothetical protein